MIVYIIGITGVGKSLLGKKLARKLNFGFVDLDAWIEIRQKKTIPQLFEKGEIYFRQCESMALQSIPTKRSLVIATGGGVVTQPENITFMRRHGFVIHLVRPVQQIAYKISTKRRPLLKGNRQALFELYNARKPLYEQARHVAVYGSDRKKALETMVKEVKRYAHSID